MSASAYTTQATSTTSLSIDVAWAFDPSTAKPSDRFLIGVLIAIFVILGICMVFMIKRALLTAIRRLRDQGTAVNVAVERKIRRRRPRLFEVWIAEAQELWTGMQYDTTNTSCTWEGLQVCHGGGSWKCTDLDGWQPLAMAVEYPVKQSTPGLPSALQATEVQNTPVVAPPPCRFAPPRSHCKMEVDSTRIDEPLHTLEEPNRCDPSLYLKDATAQVCVLIALPCPSRSSRYRFSSPSLSSEIRTEGSYLDASCSSEGKASPVPTLPSCLALGVTPSPLITYQ